MWCKSVQDFVCKSWYRLTFVIKTESNTHAHTQLFYHHFQVYLDEQIFHKVENVVSMLFHRWSRALTDIQLITRHTVKMNSYVMDIQSTYISIQELKSVHSTAKDILVSIKLLAAAIINSMLLKVVFQLSDAAFNDLRLSSAAGITQLFQQLFLLLYNSQPTAIQV